MKQYTCVDCNWESSEDNDTISDTVEYEGREIVVTTCPICGKVLEIDDDGPAEDNDFGNTTYDQERAAIELTVKRPINEYTDLDEIFIFMLQEPDVDQAKRNGIPKVKYCITRESRNGVPGASDFEYETSFMNTTRVPDEIIERAEAMIEYMDVRAVLFEDED